MKNPYLIQIKNNLPRILSLFDRDRTSPGFGLGNRYHWAWGLIDFGNGTFQGAANGLCLLWKSGLWPYATPPAVFFERIDSLFTGAAKLTRTDGSLEEAFPREGSFCVTALVAFDLLCALQNVQDEVDSATIHAWKDIVNPMIRFLVGADETHALISNHLATAVAALSRWHALTGDEKALRKANILLDKILDHQSREGWFVEYQGADPGYQSLCTYYLADAHYVRPAWNLLEPLQQSVRFLWHFAHPDGSFGGLYGSRCPRFYNPAGIEALALQISEANALAEYMAKSIAQNRVVTLSSIDEPNLVPWFNAYCWAAVLYEQHKDRGRNNLQDREKSNLQVPCQQKETSRTHFDQSGLVIDQGPEHYTIISTHKGGVVYHFQHGKAVIQDAGVVVRDTKGNMASTQGYVPDNRVDAASSSALRVESSLQAMPRRLPTPFQFMVLRLLCLTVFHSRTLRERVKRLLVKLLITGKKTLPGKNTRTIDLGIDLTIHDQFDLPPGYQKLESPGPFVAIHMASQGYWQMQDEEKVCKEMRLVEPRQGMRS